MMPLLIAGQPGKKAAKTAQEILAQVGLSERLTHRPGELSGGEQQRVAVARAAVHRPEVILADEPTGNLDHGTGEKVFDILLDLNKQQGVTLVVVTHSMQLAAKMERVLRLADGEIVDGDVR
jgi:lipoprotein-releasing system ATP-binding protein